MPGIMPRKFGKKQQQESAGDIPAGFIVLPDGAVVRGAKKGGITDHIAGPHLIPNCGREAMVPAECVRRARPAPKKKAEPPKPTFDLKDLKAAQKAMKRQLEEKARKRSRSRHRSRERSQDRSRRVRGGSSEPPRSRSKSAGAGKEEEDSPERPVKSKEQWEEDLRKEAQQEAERKEREAVSTHVQAQRLAEEKKKLDELEAAKKRKEDQDKSRRQKLSGMFALNDDDMEEEDNSQVEKAKMTRERQLAADRREARSLSAMPAASTAVVAQPTSSGGSNLPRLNTKDSVTALDIDGSGHDHKFSRVWKDWDASKKDDPGEIARQFMKVCAIKRRGYGGGAAGSRGRDRSRSRGR